jgi:phosphotransferase system enzyme I (PtsI)
MSPSDETPDAKRVFTKAATAAGPLRPEPKKPKAEAAELRFSGIAVSDGIGIGPVFGAAEPPTEVVRRKIQAADIEAQTARLETGLVQARKQLTRLRSRLAVLPEEAQGQIAPLMDAYLQMIASTARLPRGMRRRVAENLVSAETAVLDECEAQAAAILAIPIDEANEDDRAGRTRRAEEVREIGRRVVRNLTRAPFRSFSGLPDGALLVCEFLSPADAALLDPARLAGVATDEGGSDGHTAILLRALGVPAVLGVAGLTDQIKLGDVAVIDGSAGTVVLNPSSATLAQAKQAVGAFARSRQKLARLRRLPAATLDGQLIDLQANLEIPAELPLIAQAGAAGIGLLRSEFMFMNRETLPDEQAQTDHYRMVVEAMAGDPVTIRVLDWGAEKEIEALVATGMVPELAEANPALGLRGIRLLLRHTELLETQLAAILRAAHAGPVRVLLPMVTNVAEVRLAREIYERVQRRLRRRGERLPEPLPPLGIMVETPGAALSADALALEADFFAIGTNDLSMYTLAVDRGESAVASLYDPLHPAVLRLVQFTAEAALRMRKPVSVCGEMAGNPKLTPLLLGLGVRSLSMNAASVPRVKQVVRSVSIDACVRFARRVMEQSDSERVRELMREFAANHAVS